jgi:glutamate-ammonia-ligase adenylyltransferase
MAETPNPDGGLLGFRNLSEALGESPWYLKLLRDESLVLKRLAHILCVSPFIARMIERTPEAMGMLADDAMLAPRDIKSLREEMQHTGARQASIDESIQVIRNIRQRELIRIATADILSIIETEKVLSSLTDLTDACIQSAMLCYEHFYPNPGGRVSLIGLGRFGGQEMSYASDADVMVVFDASNSKDALTSYVFDMIPTLQQLFAKPAVDPALVLDFDLRPEGRQGPIARSLQSYREYYERWSLTWESQALLRARYVAGDSTLGHEFLELIEPLRYPVEGLSDTSVRDIRAMKARVESERLPRGVDPKLHLKLGPGGLSDIEWLVQFVQLLYAGKFPTLKTVSTLDVLKQLPDVIGLATSDVEHCKAVWLFASRLRNYLLLVDSKERDVLTLQPQTLRLLSYLLDEESTFDVIEHWLRLSRRARKVFTSVVYEAQN